MSFLRDWFPKLPWTIVCDVLSYLPAEVIEESLLLAPPLRNIIVEQYYSQEIHLILAPTFRPHRCVEDSQRKELMDKTNYAVCEDFLLENPDIVPRTFYVTTRSDFASLGAFLRQFRDRLSQTENLAVYIEDYNLQGADLELLFSFSNLSKLQTSGSTFESSTESLAAVLRSTSLKELVVLGHKIKDWSRFEFPASLTNLDLSWNQFTDVSTIKLPSSLTNLYWNMAGLNNEVFQKLSFPRSLTTLMLSHNDWHDVDVSKLPDTLETIDMSFNQIDRFHLTGNWPPNIKTILLNNNAISDTALQQLSQIEWPPYLQTLKLQKNRISSVEHLHNLPGNLKILDLSENPITTLEVSHNDATPYFTFPEALETLHLRECQFVNRGSTAVSIDQRITFPDTLELLDLEECGISSLSHFVFPPSLKSLWLSGNRIEDLTSYNFKFNDANIVSWRDLTGLHELELFSNRIESLCNWVPPQNLRRLDLRNNLIEVLTPVNTPLFSEAYNEQTSGLYGLDLDSNRLVSIDENVFLPRNLRSLVLKRNDLAEFVFTENIANHKYLHHLDLSGNRIERIAVEELEVGASNLKALNLGKNTPKEKFQMTVDEFYDTLGSIGLWVTKRKRHVLSEHYFGIKPDISIAQTQ